MAGASIKKKRPQGKTRGPWIPSDEDSVPAEAVVDTSAHKAALEVKGLATNEAVINGRAKSLRRYGAHIVVQRFELATPVGCEGELNAASRGPASPRRLQGAGILGSREHRVLGDLHAT